MSFHLSSFSGRFCPLFLSLRKYFFDFLHCGTDALGNILMSDALDLSNLINGHSVNEVHPKPAELCFRQLVPDLGNHCRSLSAPLGFFMPAFHNHINGRNGKRRFWQIINGRIVLTLCHIPVVLGVVVFIRPGLPLLKFFLAGEVLTGQADHASVGVYVNNRIGIFLIQRIAAFSVEHTLSSVSFWVGGEPNPKRRRTTADRKAV